MDNFLHQGTTAYKTLDTPVDFNWQYKQRITTYFNKDSRQEGSK